MLKSEVKGLLARLGYELRRKPAAGPASAEPSAAAPSYLRDSVLGALHHVRSLGWQPRSVIDVGAAHGNFSSTCWQVFPEADYLLAEPLLEYQPSLDAELARLPNAILAQVAVGADNGQATLNVHADWVGSSLYRETEGPQVDGQPRPVPMKTVDTLCQEHGLAGPYLMKIDVQGAELDVLAGAARALAQTEYVVLEVSLFQPMIGGPQLHDVVTRMLQRGFVAYDLLGYIYRPMDNALWQMDVAFVKDKGVFRTEHIYALPAQRAEQDALFRGIQQEGMGGYTVLE